MKIHKVIHILKINTVKINKERTMIQETREGLRRRSMRRNLLRCTLEVTRSERLESYWSRLQRPLEAVEEEEEVADKETEPVTKTRFILLHSPVLLAVPCSVLSRCSPYSLSTY